MSHRVVRPRICGSVTRLRFSCGNDLIGDALRGIDAGRWDDECAEHVLLDQAIAGLSADALSRDRMLTAFHLLGARGIRKTFFGRLHGRRDLLAGALDDFHQYGEHWPILANHAVGALGLGNHGIRRRHNWIIEVLGALFFLDSRLPPAFAATAGVLWPAEVDDPKQPMPVRHLARGENPELTVFDWAAWLKWRATSGRTVPGDAAAYILGRVRTTMRGGALSYPWTKPVETILQYEIGGDEIRRQALSLLAKTDYFNPENRNGILALLAIRAAALLDRSEDAPPPRPDADRYPDLAALADRLLALHRDRRVAAVPY